MTKRPNSQSRIPSFKGYSTFQPLEPEREEDLLEPEKDPGLLPEEKGTIQRYLKYADTLLNASDETPADNELVHEVSLQGKRSTDKRAA